MVNFCNPSDRKISTAVLTMPSRVRAGLAGRLRRLDGLAGWLGMFSPYTNMFVTNMFVESREDVTNHMLM